MTQVKRYPFSTAKNAHDIELYKNHLFNMMSDMESGIIPMDKTRYNRMQDMYYGDLRELLNCMVGACGRVIYLTGKQIHLTKLISAWAAEYRDYCNRQKRH